MCNMNFPIVSSLNSNRCLEFDWVLIGKQEFFFFSFYTSFFHILVVLHLLLSPADRSSSDATLT